MSVTNIGDAPRRLPSPSDPLAVAADVIKHLYTDAETKLPTLRDWRDTPMRYTGTLWEVAPVKLIENEVYRFTERAFYTKKTKANGTERVPWSPTVTKVREVVRAIAVLVETPANTELPSWIDGEEHEHPACEYVPCRNGLLHITTRTVIEHTPAMFNSIAVPYDYDPDAPPPERWLKAMVEWFPDDVESPDALQEWCGYLVSGRTDLQKALLMTGAKRGGKGTNRVVHEHLVGSGSHVGLTMSDLTNNFGLQQAIGKSLITIGDARIGRNAERALERLLSITGEDEISVDRKNLTSWHGRMTTRIDLLSNEVPDFADPSGAFASRFVVVHFGDSFLGREDEALATKLREEMPGILNWALDGLDRLNANGGHFTQPSASDTTIEVMNDAGDTVAAFAAEHLIEATSEQRISKSTLHREEYIAWCNEQRVEHPLDRMQFTKALYAVFPKMRPARLRNESGERVQYYTGIDWNPERPEVYRPQGDR